MSLHTLRHSHGSQLLSAGVPLPAVSKRLGHSNIYVTATVYAHALTSDDSSAAEKWEAAMKRRQSKGHRNAFKETGVRHSGCLHMFARWWVWGCYVIEA